MRNATERRLLAQRQSGPLRGEEHPSAKLKEEDVFEIIEAHKSGDFSQGTIAKAFGVSTTHVRAILTGRAWSWLTDISPVTKRGG